ncbi:MAG: L-threonylcarbamoyladenylate synthase [Desulfobulbaceae bacterium]|nr:L-threonylcarbamoyladenylate synthase [Desulfobulbaceae bacterium]HIJ79710.1 threonylcarbamoyl-AMP synthase [Deltaproteobacteria bacterium]
MEKGKQESPVEITEDDLRQALEVLDGGGVVAFPTETYYGLAVDPFNQAALSRLFALKRRAPDKPVLVLISDPAQLAELVVDIPPPFKLLMDRLWPGPLTLVFKGLPTIPDILTGYSGTLGVRISSHPIAMRLAAAAGRPITATSANFSGRPAAVNADGVIDQLGPDVDFILDGGETPGGNGSTIVGIDEERVVLIRSGVIPFENILDLLDPR